MPNIDEKMYDLRAVLTETLPYELPFGFTNDNLFISELKMDELSEKQQEMIKRIRQKRSDYTKPFSYQISRSSRSKNTLAIIHPATQLSIAKFYRNFQQTIIQSCSRSGFSIRAPAEVPIIHTKGTSKDHRNRWFIDLQQLEPGRSIDTSSPPSYFAYKKYLLLDRFFSSNELVRLEAKFSNMRTLDISRCFFNIYTHSICWAVKEKDFSKKYAKSYSFEQQFDKLMQLSNYNETAGIIVGPEVSRVFAEVILQKVDAEVERLVKESDGLIHNKDYAIRRYVDDFHIFSNSVETADKLEKILGEVLESYKLFLNNDKTDNVSRPFVTPVSRIKFEVSKVCSSFKQTMYLPLSSAPNESAEEGEIRKSGRLMLDALRHIGGSERAALVSSMSEVFSTLESCLRHFRKCKKEEPGAEELEDLLLRLKSVIRVLFYVTSVDFRVPPIIRASSIIKEIVGLVESFPTDDKDATLNYIAYELSELIAFNYAGAAKSLPLEVTNILLLGLAVDPVVFCSQRRCKELVVDILSNPNACYFSIICALHVINSLKEVDGGLVDRFVNGVRRRILESSFSVEVSCEDYLIFCDFLSCPAIDFDLRWGTFCAKMGGQPISKPDFIGLTKHIRHTNWKKNGVGFEIVKRRLPPVYFYA